MDLIAIGVAAANGGSGGGGSYDDTEIKKDIEQIETDILSVGERVTELENAPPPVTQLTPEFANSVDDMTDTSKVYVLAETNEIWGYIKQQTIIPESNFNVFDKSTATLNGRLSSGQPASSTSGSKGCFITDFIELTKWTELTSYKINVNFEIQNATADYNQANFYDENQNFLSVVAINQSTMSPTVGDGKTVIDLKDGGSDNAKYVKLRLYKKASGTELDTSELDGIEILFDANKTPASITEEYTWASTGHAFVPADYEDRIIDLEDDVQKLSADIIHLQNTTVGGTEGGTIPEWWENSVNECIAKIKTLQVGRNCVTFPFFSDNHQNIGYTGILIAKVMKECGIPYCFFGGDAIGSGLIADEATMIEQDKSFDNMMSYVPNGRLCRAVGNHDGFWKVSSSEKYHYTRPQVYELFLRTEGTAQNKNFGGDGTYYYIDDTPSKVRWIVLDTNAQPVGTSAESIDSEQLTWLQNMALKFNESGWGVVIISHCPIANPYHANVTNAVEVINIIKSYISGTGENKADIIGWYSGHVHRDRIYTNLYVNGNDLGYAGEPDIELGFTQVVITSDRTDIAYGELVDGELVTSPTKHPIGDDDQSHAIDFVTINKYTRTVNITRLGIGEDRSYTY